jgi:tetratricopeptide (TPR) repeat protein
MSASHPEAPYLPYIAQLRATAERGMGKPVQAMDNLGANAGADLQWSDPWADEVLALKTGYLHTIELVEALIAAGRPEEAIAKIAEITEHKPNDPGALNYHAGALFRMKRFDEGIAILQGLLQIDPDHYATNLNIARGYERVGKTELALQHIQRSLEVNPDFAEGHFRHGRLLLQMGRSPEAIESLKQAIRLNPSDLNAKMLLSETYIKRAEWAEARAVLADIVSSHPRLADAHLNLGVASAELGQFEQASESVNRALECGADAAKAHTITARIRQLQSNPKVDSAQ